MHLFEEKGKPTAVESAVEQMIRYMSDEGLEDGNRLPNERDLAVRLGVGRSTLREALQCLVSRNVLEVRRGVGTFVSYKHGVADDPLGFNIIRDKKKLAQDLVEFRILIEPPMAAWAARNATPEAVDELEYLCGQVEDLIRAGQPHMEKDKDFHTRIARCSGNLIMPKLLPIIHGAISLFIMETGAQLREETIRTHRAVLNAIRAGDAPAASDAMYLHLIYNRDRLRPNSITTGGQYSQRREDAPETTT